MNPRLINAAFSILSNKNQLAITKLSGNSSYIATSNSPQRRNCENLTNQTKPRKIKANKLQIIRICSPKTQSNQPIDLKPCLVYRKMINQKMRHKTQKFKRFPNSRQLNNPVTCLGEQRREAEVSALVDAIVRASRVAGFSEGVEV